MGVYHWFLTLLYCFFTSIVWIIDLGFGLLFGVFTGAIFETMIGLVGYRPGLIFGTIILLLKLEQIE